MSGKIKSQQIDSSFCSNYFEWENLELNHEKLSDNCLKIFIVTNRSLDTLNKRNIILPNKLADSNKLNYLIASCDKTKWNLSSVNSFNEGMYHIDRGKDIVLFIHGNGKSLPMALSRAYRIQKKYDVSVILFDWPSRNITITKSMKMVRKCEPNFYKLLSDLDNYRNKKMKEGQHLSIIAHSLGNYFLTYMAKNRKTINLSDNFIDNLILNAPAVKARNHDKLIEKLNFQNNIYITLNKNDFVLRGAQMISAIRLLGNVPLKKSAQNAEYIHFTKVAKREHTYFIGYLDFEYTNPAIIDFYSNAIHGLRVDLSKKKFYNPRKKDNGYEIKKNNSIN